MSAQGPSDFRAAPGPGTEALQRLSCMLRDGSASSAETHARALLAEYPKSGELRHLLGLALRVQGKECLELLEQAARLLPADAGAQANFGSELARRGRHAQAIAAFERALQLRPSFIEAQRNLARVCNDLGIALHELGRLGEAESSYRRAIALDERCAEAHNNLGNLLRATARLDEAVAAYHRALGLQPDFAQAHCNLAVALRLQGRRLEARERCRRALAIAPRMAQAVVTLAETHADGGDFPAAEALYRVALGLEPDSPQAWAGLGRIRRMTLADETWLASVRRIVDQPLAPRQEALLRYALGKYFDDVGDPAQAFDQYRRANQLDRTQHAGYDRRALSEWIDRIIERQDRRGLQSLNPCRIDSELPVLIVGMPRSGTTLAEQILATHPAVVGAGELAYWSRALDPRAAPPAQPPPWRELASGYLQELGRHAGQALRVVDKMPGNFMHLGVIHALLPGVRVIHMRRDPVDTCLSVYFQHFEGFHPYANDLADLAHYYGEYLRLMDHWRKLLPAPAFLELRYEDLVSEPERFSRKMVGFLGLPWDARCLDFHSTGRPVLTASQWQVRQKISRGSVGRWRRYGRFIGPLSTLRSADGGVPASEMPPPATR